MIQLSNLSKSFADRVLLDSVSWQIDNRERVGLSGPNGAGKTTLLKMLAGLEEPDSGLVVKPAGLTIGYLPQDGLHHTGRSLIEEAGQAFKSLLDMRAEIAALENRLADDSAHDSEHEGMLSRYSDLQESFRRLEGFSVDLKIHTVLRGLGFTKEDLEKPTETFSGGWQMRGGRVRIQAFLPCRQFGGILPRVYWWLSGTRLKSSACPLYHSTSRCWPNSSRTGPSRPEVISGSWAVKP